MSRYELLLSPLRIGNVVFKNRIFTSPHVLTQLQDAQPRPTAAFAAHYVELAKGGAACVIVGGSSFRFLNPGDRVDGESGYFNIYGVEYMRPLVEMVDKIHSYGAKACLQQDWHVLYGYTASPGIPLLPLQDEYMSKGEMSEEIMNRIADDYAAAAEQALAMGFDMFQLHFSSGAMFMQFLSRSTNRRTDKYGGCLENRARFPIMVIDRIRERVGRRLLLHVKLCAEEGMPGGITIDETVEFLKMIEDKVDIAHLAGGTHYTPEGMRLIAPLDFEPPLQHVEWSIACKKAGIKIPVEANGGLQDPDEMEGILQRGEADIVSLARGLIADPELPNKLYRGQADSIRPCIKCIHCVSGVAGLKFSCSVNPRAGREHMPMPAAKADTKRRVAVIGGGPAGMEAAITAASRGHDVTLFEKSGSLGGNTQFCELPIKRSLKKYIGFMIKKTEESGAKICLSTEATPELLDKQGFEDVIIAIGATQKLPNIPGAEQHGIMIRDYYNRPRELGERVVIIGGGVSGCEAALHLARLGKRVTVIERSHEPGSHERSHRTQGYGYMMQLLLELRDAGRVEIITDAECRRLAQDCVEYSKGGKVCRIEGVDSALIAVGMENRQEEALRLWRPGTHTSMAGDCELPANIENAVHTAYDAAMNI